MRRRAGGMKIRRAKIKSVIVSTATEILYKSTDENDRYQYVI